MSQAIRKLYRSSTEARLAGVCGGLGQYLSFDPVIVRLLWVGITCLTGVIPGVLAYLAAWIIVPLEEPVQAQTPVEQPNEGTV